MSATLTVLVVDDHPVVRAGLRALLDGNQGVVVVGEAANVQDAVRATASLRPDLVLMDLQLGDVLDGVEATRRIVALEAPPRVLVLTTYETDADIVRAIEAGAAGYLLKDTPPADLFRALRAAVAGETALAPRVAQRLMRRLQCPEPVLSPREIEILELLACGLANKAIGRELYISEATVKTHLVHVYEKLGVENRTAAIAAALQRSLIRLPNN